MKKKAVKTVSIFVLYLLSIDINISSAQIIAGSVPTGTSIQYLNIMLVNSVIGSTVSDSLDIDCDNIKDIAFDLYKGNTIVDQSNDLWYRVLNGSVEICTDTGNVNWAPPLLYDAGDTMSAGLYQWNLDTEHRLACGGGFCWTGYHQETDKYFTYRKISTQEMGWIKISFDLFGSTVTASVSEILVLCTETGTNAIGRELLVSITPNPTTDGKIKLQCRNKITQIEIRNALGEVVKIIRGGETDITLPEESGLYIIMVIDDKGNFGTEKIWRQ